MAKAAKKPTTQKTPARKPQQAQGTDATKLLKADHEKVKAMFEEMEDLSDRATAKRQKLFEELKTELQVHTKIEEEIFYPAVQALRTKEAKDKVLEANEEHALAKQLIAQISALEPDDEKFKAKCKVLMDVVLHHAKEEEKEMFPEAKAGMSAEELKSLGAKLEERKEALLASGEDLGETDGMEMAAEEGADEEDEEDADEEDADEEEDDDGDMDDADEDDESEDNAHQESAVS